MRIGSVVALALCLLLVVPSSAWAYIDPGSGSMVYQVLLAGAVAVGIGLRRAWKWIGSRKNKN